MNCVRVCVCMHCSPSILRLERNEKKDVEPDDNNAEESGDKLCKITQQWQFISLSGAWEISKTGTRKENRVFLFTSFVHSSIPSVVWHSAATPLIVIVARANCRRACECVRECECTQRISFVSLCLPTRHKMSLLYIFFFILAESLSGFWWCSQLRYSYLFTHTLHVRRLSALIQCMNTRNVYGYMWSGFFSSPLRFTVFVFFPFFEKHSSSAISASIRWPILHLELVFKMIMYYCCLIICIFILNK